MNIRNSTTLRELMLTYPEDSREIIDEVFKAEWIEDSDEERRPGSHFYCSNCNKMQGMNARVMKYCPECGCRMFIDPQWEFNINPINKPIKSVSESA